MGEGAGQGEWQPLLGPNRGATTRVSLLSVGEGMERRVRPLGADGPWEPLGGGGWDGGRLRPENKEPGAAGLPSPGCAARFAGRPAETLPRLPPGRERSAALCSREGEKRAEVPAAMLRPWPRACGRPGCAAPGRLPGASAERRACGHRSCPRVGRPCPRLGLVVGPSTSGALPTLRARPGLLVSFSMDLSFQGERRAFSQRSSLTG